MNYLHSFHAGNFADVFKHITLILLLEAMQQKETGFCYMDTHAGCGYYDLLSAPAQKTQEYKNGIQNLFYQNHAPDIIQRYLLCVQKINQELNHSSLDSVRYYPGSPWIARYFLRQQDQMILSELHREEYQSLKTYFLSDPKVHVHFQNGYLNLKALLPPKERRGLILIDPPYEKPQEFTDIAKAMHTAMQRFETGIYAIWYPIKDQAPINRFHHALKENIQRPILISELNLFPPTTALQLNGCGMAIINPPYKLAEHLTAVLPWLQEALNISHLNPSRTMFL